MKRLAPSPSKPKPQADFPEVEIREDIRRFWEKKKVEEENPFVPARKDTLHEVLPEIDSLEIVRFFVQIEQIIDREVPACFIQRGGYNSCDEMTRHLLPQLRQLYAEQRSEN